MNSLNYGKGILFWNKLDDPNAEDVYVASARKLDSGDDAELIVLNALVFEFSHLCFVQILRMLTHGEELVSVPRIPLHQLRDGHGAVAGQRGVNVQRSPNAHGSPPCAGRTVGTPPECRTCIRTNPGPGPRIGKP